jgi:endogenous inhibitor of DNA gyrase (YacG/DUF329 family)
MSGFGEIVQGSIPPEEQSSQPVNGVDHSAAAIDPNDPRLTSEVLTINPDADAYAILPPLPDGKWRAKAKQLDIKDDKGQLQRYAVFSRAKMANGAPFFATNIEYSVIDYSGDFDGVKLSEYWVKTLVDLRKGTSQAATMIGKLGGKIPPSATQKQMMEALLTALASEPELVLETAWSAECQNCQEVAKKTGAKAPRPFLQGMHRFPSTRTPGVHDPIVSCPTCRQQVRAQARIVSPFSLKETQPSRGLSTTAKSA